MLVRNYIKDDGEYFYFLGELMEVYIPIDFVEKNIASNHGSFITSIGLLPFRIFDKNNKLLEERLLNLPTNINFFPEDTEIQSITLKHDNEPKKYLVMKFYKNSKLCLSSAPKNVENVELFLKMMTSGKINYVSYNDVLNIWLNNNLLNSVSLGVTAVVMEIIISEIYRNTNKQEERFGKQMGKDPKTDPYSYTAVNMRTICAKNSVFSAITFEDMDQMITSSLNMVNYDKKQIQSPIEKIIKM